jgi:hypothetical protein
LEGRDGKDHSSRPALTKSSWDPISTNGGTCLSSWGYAGSIHGGITVQAGWT